MKQAQNITLYFRDGNGRERVIQATVPAFDGDVEGLRLMDISISLPYDLPEGCRWEKP